MRTDCRQDTYNRVYLYTYLNMWACMPACVFVCMCVMCYTGFYDLAGRSTTTIMMKKSDANRLRYNYYRRRHCRRQLSAAMSILYYISSPVTPIVCIYSFDRIVCGTPFRWSTGNLAFFFFATLYYIDK